MKKVSTVFWGLFFLFAAAFVLASQLGVVAPGLSLWKLLLSILLLALTVQGIRYAEFFGILMPIAGILCLFSAELGLQAITPWPVLGSAALASTGLHIIFRNRLRDYHRKVYHNAGHWAGFHESEGWDGDSDRVENLNENSIKCNLAFGSSIKYLHSQNLERADFSCSFGALKVYFDQAKLSENGAEVNVDCAFSGITLYVPHSWKVIDNMQASAGVVKSRDNQRALNENVMHLRGSVAFGSVEIIYI